MKCERIAGARSLSQRLVITPELCSSENHRAKLRSFQESPTMRSIPSSKRWRKTRRRMEWGHWRKTERCCCETRGRWRSWKPNSTQMMTVSADLLKCPIAAAVLVLFCLFSASTWMILTDLDVFQCFFFNAWIYNMKNYEIDTFYSGDGMHLNHASVTFLWGECQLIPVSVCVCVYVW